MSRKFKLLATAITVVAISIATVFCVILMRNLEMIKDGNVQRTPLELDGNTAIRSHECVIDGMYPGDSGEFGLTLDPMFAGYLTVSYEEGEVATLAPFLQVTAFVDDSAVMTCSFQDFTQRVGELSRQVEGGKKTTIKLAYSMPIETDSSAEETELKFRLVFSLDTSLGL